MLVQLSEFYSVADLYVLYGWKLTNRSLSRQFGNF